MNKELILKLLAGASVIGTILHQQGVSLGHLGSSDFVQLGTNISELVYQDLLGESSDPVPVSATPATRVNPILAR